MFSRQAAPLLGLDISSSSVKLVELSRGKDGNFILERCAIEPLERGWINDGNVEKVRRGGRSHAPGVKKSGTRTRNVAMALPASAVITKKIILPGGMSDQDLEVQVETEANQYIPFSLDEVSLDFCVVGPSPTSSRRRRGADRRLAQGKGAGPPGPGRSRRPEARDHRRRILCLAPGRRPPDRATCPTRAATRWSRCSKWAPPPPACR
jgi:hypothetical protein